MGVLLCSMSVSVDGFINDRSGGFAWTPPSEELFGFHLAGVRELGAYICGRRLYEAMLPWETDPAMRSTELYAEFADVWCALPKVVLSRTLTKVRGHARLATGSVAQEIATTLAQTDKDVSIGGAGLVHAAVEEDLLDELRMFRHPVLVGGGTPLLPPVAQELQLELLETRTFDSRVVWERYRRVRDKAA